MIKILLIIIVSLIINTYSFSNEKIQNIEIVGNDRISEETILMFSGIEKNQNINENTINDIIKNLYETNFFNNINITLKDKLLTIVIEENPLIQNIIYTGIKSKSLRNDVLGNVVLKSRTSFSDILLEQDRINILNNLKKQGYFFSEISIKKKNLEDNKIDLEFNIILGDKSKIKTIKFIGNKIFKDKKLRNIIISEEAKFWKFLSNRKYLNEDIVALDKRLLKNFYLNKGFYDVVINSSYAKVLEDKNFELVFNIDAKNKFYFNDLKVEFPIDFEEKYFERIKSNLLKLKGEIYSINKIQKIVEDLELVSIQEEYQSITTNVNENIVDNKINLTFQIQETEKYFVNRINIFGNNVTQENVIRNQLEIDEGDPFNEILSKKSINSIKSLGFFKSVKEEVISDDVNKLKDINITVIEKPTGEILAGAGIGTSGGTATFSVKENNYLGKGVGLQALASINENSVKGKFSVSNPNFNDTDKQVRLSIEALETDLLSTSGYKSNKTGFSIDTNFEYLDNLMLGLGQSSFYESITTNSTASQRQKKQEGNYWDTFLSINADYDKRNQKFQTTDGFRSYYAVNLPIISDTKTLTNTYSYIYYDELYENNVSSISFFAKAANSITGKDVKLSERVFVPGSKLRGFEQGKVGPKDGDDFIGGNFVSTLNFSSTLPQILPNSQNTDFLIFFDIANIWGVDYDSSLNSSNKIRSSVGVGIDWFSVLGPLTFSLSQPLSKTSTDQTETFRFNLGTTF